MKVVINVNGPVTVHTCPAASAAADEAEPLEAAASRPFGFTRPAAAAHAAPVGGIDHTA